MEQPPRRKVWVLGGRAARTDWDASEAGFGCARGCAVAQGQPPNIICCSHHPHPHLWQHQQCHQHHCQGSNAHPQHPMKRQRHTRKILMCGATPVYIVEYRVKTVGGLCQCYWLDTPHKYLPHFPQLHFTKYSKHVDIGSYHIYQMSVFRRRGCQGDYYRYSWGGDGHGREVMDMVGR